MTQLKALLPNPMLIPTDFYTCIIDTLKKLIHIYNIEHFYFSMSCIENS
jgi:hypothetical protein